MKTANQLPTLHYFHDIHCAYSNITYPHIVKAMNTYADRINFQPHNGELYNSIEGMHSTIRPVLDKLEVDLHQRTGCTLPKAYITFIREQNPLLSSQFAGKSVSSVRHQNPALEMLYAQHMSNCFVHHALVPLNKKDNLEIFERFLKENDEARNTLNTEKFVEYHNSDNSLQDYNNDIKLKRNMGVELYPTLCYTNNNGETVRIFDAYADYNQLCQKLDNFIQAEGQALHPFR